MRIAVPRVLALEGPGVDDRGMGRVGFLLAVLSLIAGPWRSVTAAETPTHELRVDFSKINGLIRPLHGVNLGPLCYRGTVDVSEYHRELAIPLTRLHDVPWVNAEAVDIHTEVDRVDEHHNLDRVAQGILSAEQSLRLDLPAPGVALIRLSPE